MIKKAIKILLIFLLFIYLSSCASFRSAEGLNGGEVSIAYIAPAAGAVRVGITNNLEARASFVGKALRSDLFVHTKNDSGKFNFGFTLGLRWVYSLFPTPNPATILLLLLVIETEGFILICHFFILKNIIGIQNMK